LNLHHKKKKFVFMILFYFILFYFILFYFDDVRDTTGGARI